MGEMGRVENIHISASGERFTRYQIGLSSNPGLGSRFYFSKKFEFLELKQECFERRI